MDSIPSPGPSVPSLILPPTGDPPPRTYHLTSTQDLVSRFNLLPAYDKYVRPQTQQPDPPEPSEDKKKRPTTSYKHLIKQIPGKHSMRKDDYLISIMQAPPKDRVPILPFDVRTLRDAFTVSPEPLKGWPINSLVAESPEAREDRKKRKELRKLAKAQAQAGSPPPIPLSTPEAAATAASPSARLPPSQQQLPPPQQQQQQPLIPRGKKRELDPDTPASALSPPVRSRPLKKQRLDSMPIQQPTPQGL